MAIQPFRVSVPEETLQDLGRRLDHTRWPDEPADAGWRYGSALAAVRDLAAYWRQGYDWRAQEAALNRFDQFVASSPGSSRSSVRGAIAAATC